MIEPDVTERGGYSQSALERRGWTKARIAKLLGAPDREAENPQFPTGARMRIWATERVAAAEATEEFAAAMAAKRGAHNE